MLLGMEATVWAVSRGGHLALWPTFLEYTGRSGDRDREFQDPGTAIVVTRGDPEGAFVGVDDRTRGLFNDQDILDDMGGNVFDVEKHE